MAQNMWGLIKRSVKVWDDHHKEMIFPSKRQSYPWSIVGVLINPHVSLNYGHLRGKGGGAIPGQAQKKPSISPNRALLS